MKSLKFNIAVTGVPGTGKSTLCKELRSEDFRIVDLNNVSEENGCTEDGNVSIECLEERIKSLNGFLLDGHYSHLLTVYGVIIMECSSEVLEKRLILRGYEKKKIDENIDCLLSDSIWFESRDMYPESRIVRIRSDREGSLNKAKEFIRRLEIKYNGS